jgi:arylamine N-acetyltransferase
MLQSAYTSDQLSEWLKHVGLSAKYHTNASPQIPRDLRLLKLVHVHQASAIPYDNLSLHYRSASENEGKHLTNHGAYMSLDPQYLFDKFVRQGRGRGGYCFQVVLFFHHILRALGFQVYMAQAKIRLREDNVPKGDFIGYTHAVNIVTLADGSRHSLDVSFGGDGPIEPLPLIHEHVTQNIGTQQLRLIRDYIPEQGDKVNPQKLWIYQYRNSTDESVPWNSYYAFAELEALPEDFKYPNWFVSQHPDSFQTARMLITKFLKRDREDGSAEDSTIYGKIMLASDSIKQNTGGKTELVKVCKSEQERIEALKEYFGIILTEEEKAGILRRPTEIKAADSDHADQ